MASEAWPTIPADWIAAQVLTSGDLNALFDALRHFDGEWATYTPTWTAASLDPTLGNGTIAGGILLTGKTLTGRIALTCGSTTDGGAGMWSFGLPSGVTIASGLQLQTCTVGLRDESLNRNYAGFAVPATTTTLKVGSTGEDWLGDGDLFTLATDDLIYINYRLEVD